MRIKHTLSLLLSGIFLSVGPGLAVAQDYPSRGVQMIYPFPPGSSTDLAARLLAKLASERLNASIVVVNRPGANGVIGAQALVKAVPDGYTLMLGTPDTNIIQPLVNPKIPYSSDRDFVPVAKISDVFLVLTVSGQVPANNISEFVAYAKGKNPPLRYSTYGPGTLPHVATELLLNQLGVKMQHIPYQGGAAAALALARGDVDLNLGGLANVRPHAQDKKVKIIAVAQESESDRVPGVAPLRAAGSPYVVSGWNGVFGPAGLPDQIANKLSDAFVAVAESAEFRKTLAAAGADSNPLSRPNFIKYFNAERERWAKVVRENGIKVD